MKTVRAGCFETNSSSSHVVTVLKYIERPTEPCAACGGVYDETSKRDWEHEYHWVLPSGRVRCEECLKLLLSSSLSVDLRNDIEAITDEGLLNTEYQAKPYEEAVP